MWRKGKVRHAISYMIFDRNLYHLFRSGFGFTSGDGQDKIGDSKTNQSGQNGKHCPTDKKFLPGLKDFLPFQVFKVDTPLRITKQQLAGCQTGCPNDRRENTDIRCYDE